MFTRILPGREAETMAFLSREPDVNHFILGDIESFGLHDPNLSLWAEDRGGIRAVLLRYYGSFILYAPEGADCGHVARIMRDSGYGVLSGRPEYIHPVIEALGAAPDIKANVLMKLEPGALRPAKPAVQAVEVTLANLETFLPGIVALRQGITEFAAGINVEALRDEMHVGCKRIFVALENNAVASMVMTTVERRNAAMIVSVCTRQESRGRGYAGALMTELCRALAAESKTAVLFFNNPVAGRIYESLGFQDIGRWCFVTF